MCQWSMSDSDNNKMEKSLGDFTLSMKTAHLDWNGLDYCWRACVNEGQLEKMPSKQF